MEQRRKKLRGGFESREQRVCGFRAHVLRSLFMFCIFSLNGHETGFMMIANKARRCKHHQGNFSRDILRKSSAARREAFRFVLGGDSWKFVSVAS
jgi:hypothetical protein